MRPGRSFMKIAGNEFLAGSALSFDQDRCRSRRHGIDHPQNPDHPRIPGQDGARDGLPGACAAYQQGRRGSGTHRLQDLAEILRLEGLCQKIDSPLLHRRHSLRNRSIPCHENDTRQRCGGAKVGEELHSVDGGHPHIADHPAIFLPGELLQRLFPVLGKADPKPVLAKGFSQRDRHLRLVVNHQNASGFLCSHLDLLSPLPDSRKTGPREASGQRPSSRLPCHA